MCSIEKSSLCTFCNFNKKCEEEREQLLHELCFKWWNFDEVPPASIRTDELMLAMMNYIHSHPEKFRGARPQ